MQINPTGTVECPTGGCCSQNQARSQEHDGRHQTSRDALNSTQSSGRVVSRRRSSHRGGRRGAGIGGSRDGHAGAGGRARGRRRGIRFTGILAATGGGLLASLLGLGVVGVVVDALAESGLADIEGDGLDVLGDIRGLSIVALAAELQCGLGGIILACRLRARNLLRIAYRVAAVLLRATLAEFRADIALALAPRVCRK